MKRPLLCTPALLAATLFVGPAALGQAQSSSSPNSSSSASSSLGQSSSSASGAQDQQGMNDPDKMFVKMTAVNNMCEMQLAQLAQTKSHNDQVKQLARQILQDHQQAGQQLQQVAQKLQVQVPQQLPRMKQQEVQFFSQLSGDDFDKQFVSCMKAAHAAAISRFGDVAKIAKNDDVKQFAQQVLPKLQEHGQMVTQLAQAQGLGTEMMGQAQQAGATIQPSSPSGASSTDHSGPSSSPPAGTSGSPNASQSQSR